MGVRVPGCLSVFPILFLSNSLCLYLLLLSFSLSYSFSLALSYFFFPTLSLLFPFYFSVLPSSLFITPLYTSLTLSLNLFLHILYSFSSPYLSSLCCLLPIVPLTLPSLPLPLHSVLCALALSLSTLTAFYLPVFPVFYSIILFLSS